MRRPIFKIKQALGMTEQERHALMDKLHDWWQNDPRPLVVGEDVEVVWEPVERWEHVVFRPANYNDVQQLIEQHEPRGWQVAALVGVTCEVGMMLVLKRPATEETEADDDNQQL